MSAWTRLRARSGGPAPAAQTGRDLLKWTAAGFALVATATAEYELARAIGMNEWVAAAVPGALDAYVVRALRAHREVLTAVLAMVAVNAASHLVTAGVLKVEWPLITAVSAIAPLVLWRVHALGTPGEWRARKLWSVPERARTDEHTGTEPVRDVSGMPHLCTHGCTVWGDVEAHERAHENAGFETPEHTASTDQEAVRAQTDAWGDDWMDVHAAVHAPGTAARYTPADPCDGCGSLTCTGALGGPCGAAPVHTPPIPVHAPYEDHVHARHLTLVKDVHTGFDPVHAAVHAPDPVCTDCGHTEHTGDCVHTSTDTRTADDWDLEHVAKGVLEPEDTVHMDRARELFHTGGGMPTYRALKDGQPGMGTPRASRIRAALKIEAEGAER